MSNRRMHQMHGGRVVIALQAASDLWPEQRGLDKPETQANQGEATTRKGVPRRQDDRERCDSLH